VNHKIRCKKDWEVVRDIHNDKVDLVHFICLHNHQKIGIDGNQPKKKKNAMEQENSLVSPYLDHNFFDISYI
jgi:hypothetical protein